MIDLDAYFTRIGYAGPRTPTLETLRALHTRHTQTIAFENLNPLLGHPVSLDLADIETKLVKNKRGGYCFEQNALFRFVLESIGFSVIPLSARVRWMAPPERPMNPRTHMLLRVDLAGETYISDVGFGSLLQDVPLRLVADIEQPTAYETFRYVREDGVYKLQARLPTGWQDAYHFLLDPQVAADYTVASWYTSTHPQSLFRNNLLVERLLPDARLSLFNRKLTRRFCDGRVEQSMLTSQAQLDRVLTEDFGLSPPAEAAMLFDRLPR